MSHPSELISAYLDGELTVAEHVDLQRHLSACGSCALEIEEIQQVRSAVRSLPVLELPAGVIPEADAEVIPIHRNRGLWVGTAAAVIALIIAIAALVTPPPATVSVDDLSSRFGARVTLDPSFSPAKVVMPALGEVNR